MASPHYLIIYAYYETADSRRNLGFFCRHAITPFRDRQYVIVINGVCSIEDQIPKFENVMVMRRGNAGFDFGAWAHAMRQLPIEQFDYFLLLNSSVTGPFLPLYQDASHWPELFVAMLNDRVKLAGITINVYQGEPIVQSMLLATDRVGLHLLISNGIFSGNDQDASKWDVIVRREVFSSKIILAAGLAVDCLAVSHSKRSMHLLRKDTSGDIFSSGRYAVGHTLEPLEVCFFKTNRGCSPGAVDKCMLLTDYKRATLVERCFHEDRIMRTLAALKRAPSTFSGHLEFAIWLTCRFLPQVVVDLGDRVSTYAWGAAGVSSVIGVDRSEGDDLSDLLGADLRRDLRYEDTVRIWKSSRAEAARSFDGRVDVLHVSGLPAYEVLKRDLDSWMPKLSRGGLVVLHDLCASPGVAQMFSQMPHAKTRFEHSAGLGIVSSDKTKIDTINREWRDKLYAQGSELRHRDFDHLRIAQTG